MGHLNTKEHDASYRDVNTYYRIKPLRQQTFFDVNAGEKLSCQVLMVAVVVVVAECVLLFSV